MPRKSTTKSTTAQEVVVDNTAATSTAVVVDDTIAKKDNTKGKAPLNDYEEIEVVSIVPHVSYKDSETGDMYEWDDVGHSEYMTVKTLKNLWRNHKSYFKNLLLKPLDARIINRFGLTKTFENYEYLMDESNYTRTNIDSICQDISETPNGLKYAVCNKVKSMVSNGDITDIAVIKALDRHLNLDLISSL